MWNYLTEKFLTEFFLYENVLGVNFDEQMILNFLNEIFLLSDTEKNFVDKLLEGENISEIKTESDFMRYQRVRKYFAFTKTKVGIDIDEERAITLKGTAMGIAKAIGCSSSSTLTGLQTEENLSAAATGGNIAAMRLAGLMLSEGVLFIKDTEKGLHYLRMAASWNDVLSLIYALHYDKKYTSRYEGKLGFLLKAASHGEILPLIEDRYGRYEHGEPREAKLLERLFQLNVLKREIYSAPHARALFSRALSYKDKEKLLYTSGKDYMPMVGDLPLKLGEAQAITFDYGAFADMPLTREEEHRGIISRLDNSDLRGMYSYRPLCMSSDSFYLLQMYADVIAASAPGIHVEYINVNELDMHRLDHGKNNIFIRSCDEDKENIYFLFFSGDIPNIVVEQVKMFLKSEGRIRFSLNAPYISLNLSGILPICFCDPKNEKNLYELCDVIRIADCSKEEKYRLLQCITEEKARSYGIPEIELQDALRDKLLSLDIDEMEKELDLEVSGNRVKNEKLILTENNYTASRGNEDRRYGFGGFKK